MAFNQDLRVNVIANTKGFNNAMRIAGAIAVAAFVKAIKVTAEFEKQLSELEGVSRSTGAQMVKLEKQARDLGKSTAFTATEVAKAQTELARLGFTTNEILNSTGGVLDLAAGLRTDLASAAELTGSTIRQFGLDAKDSVSVVDILSKSTTTSALNFEKLRESLKLIGPVANSFSISLEETVGILRTLADAGISGSMAGTSLRQAFLDLNKAGVTLPEALDKIATSTDQAGTALELVGKRAATAFVVLANQGYDSVTNFDGAANDLRETMEDNLIGDFDKLTSAVTEIGIQFGQISDGSLRNFVQQLTELAGVVSGMINSFKDNAFINGISALLSLGGSNYDDFKARIESQSQLNVIGGPETGTTGGGTTGGGSTNQSTGGGTIGTGGGNRASVSSVNGLTPEGLQTLTTSLSGLTEGLTALDPEREAYLQGLLKMLEQSEIVAEGISDAFNNMGANISQSLTDSLGIFGAFLGGIIESLLKFIGQKAAAAVKSAAIDKASAAATIATKGAEATANVVAGATSAAAASGPAAPFLLPALIAGGLAAIAFAFKGSGGGGGGGTAAATGTISTPTATPINVSSDTSNNLPSEITLVADGDSLRGVLSQAQYNYAGFNGQ